MLLYVTIALALLALLIVVTAWPPAAPTRCRCGRPADVFDHARPWIVWCGKCWLRQKGGKR